MNKKNLYYKRGMYLIDKMLNTFKNDTSFYKKRLEFFKTEFQRILANRELVVKDMNSFYITAVATLLGLNKENIEKLNRHNDYNLFHFTKYAKERLNVDQFNLIYPEFSEDRNISTQFDEWLSVEQCDYPTLNYMMNIRNGLLHSEYEPLDEYGFLLSIKNSNYTHFKSKVMLPGILSFCMFYFGNNAWNGIIENFNVYYSTWEGNIKSELDLKEAIKQTNFYEVEYSYQGNQKNTNIPEKKLYKLFTQQSIGNNNIEGLKSAIENVFTKDYEYTIKEQTLTEEQRSIVQKMVEKYYGTEFYNFDENTQVKQISSLARYLIASRTLISEWICDYITLFDAIRTLSKALEDNPNKNIDGIEKILELENNCRSVFACRTSLLIVKLYYILYRLQNKKYEEIDYNKIDFDITSSDYTYERTDIDGSITNTFDIDKYKLQTKEPSLTNCALENKVICQIIRNAISHGNIELNFKLENDILKEYIVFNDNYHSKNRKLEMTVDKLEKLLNSEAFTTKECLIKEEPKPITYSLKNK